MRLAIVGGGISGLAAAYFARREFGPDATIDIVDRAERPGGTLRSVMLAGHPFDVGAEAFVVRRPEALELITELGLADQLVSPIGRRPVVFSGDQLHALPAPSLMGIPVDADAATGLATAGDLDRMRSEPATPFAWTSGTNTSVGDLVGERFGLSVVARAVDPMLGGVYSSLAADIGVREALPALAAKLDAGVSNLTDAVRGLVPAQSDPAPVFGALRGGYRVLVDRLVEASAAQWHSTTERVELTRHSRGFAVDGVGYDAVIVALPAPAAAAVVSAIAPDVATQLETVHMAGSAVAALALPPDTQLPDNSGVLVASDSSLRVKAFTFSSLKWGHFPVDAVLVRASFGRFGQPVTASDAELIDWAVADLARVCETSGRSAPGLPVDAVVQRWPAGLPVYAPGHATAMKRALDARPARLGLAGAAYSGVGVPACIGQARSAVRAVVADVAASGTMDS